MELKIKAICSGTEVKTSRKSGNTYSITKLVEVPSMKVLEIFGDLGLPQSFEPREYILQCDVPSANNVVVIAGGTSGKNTPK